LPDALVSGYAELDRAAPVENAPEEGEHPSRSGPEGERTIRPDDRRRSLLQGTQ
jgi:hypothetical protein